MKRLWCWTAAVALAGGSLAMGQLAYAETIGSGAACVRGGSCGDMGIGGCCEREFSPLDGVWSDYCAQKPHCHPASTFFGALHVKSHCGAAAPCGPACGDACGACGCKFGLPQIKLPKLFCSAPTCEPSCPQPACDEPACNRCPPPRKSLFGSRRKGGCAACGEAACEQTVSCPSGSAVHSESSAPAAPAVPADVSPSESNALDLPPAIEPSHDARGWLPFPRLKLLPL